MKITCKERIEKVLIREVDVNFPVYGEIDADTEDQILYKRISEDLLVDIHVKYGVIQQINFDYDSLTRPGKWIEMDYCTGDGQYKIEDPNAIDLAIDQAISLLEKFKKNRGLLGWSVTKSKK